MVYMNDIICLLVCPRPFSLQQSDGISQPRTGPFQQVDSKFCESSVAAGDLGALRSVGLLVGVLGLLVGWLWLMVGEWLL